MYEDMKNKTVLITGAGKGIGRVLVQKLVTAGVHVIAVARSPEQLAELQTNNPGIKTIQVDLSDWQRVKESFSTVPQLDGLVNNAGVAIIKPFEELNEQDFDETFDVNIKAVFNVTQTLLPKLKNGASIVMVSSVASSRTFPNHTIYSATKAALDSFARSLAFELAERKIRVNSVNPTVVLTAMGQANWSDPAKAAPLLARIPLRRFCEVFEVVDSIVYLLSTKSNFINGHHLNLEGGYCAS